MDKIKSLELKKLLKELDFIETDYEYRSEVVSDADSEFMNCINDFLSKNPEIKDLYDRKVTNKIDKIIYDIESESVNLNHEFEKNSTDNLDNDDFFTNEKSPELKKIYREIVKITHPDKIKDKKMNDIYIKSTELYNNDDKIGLYKICDEINITYQIDESDIDIIEDKINTLKRKINFLESTFTWKWLNTKDSNQKDKILLDFIGLKTSVFS